MDHSVVRMNTVPKMFAVTPRKQSRTQLLAGKLMRQVSRGSRLLSVSALKMFCGVALSLHLAVPLARFYRRGLYDCITTARRVEGIIDRGQG